MAKLVWALLCRRVIVDSQTNLLSYVDALDGFNAPQFPITAPLIVACSVWQRENDERSISMRVLMYSPNGARLFVSDENTLALETVHKRARLNAGIAGFEIPSAGRYEVAFELKHRGEWVEQHRVPIDIDPTPGLEEHAPRHEQETAPETPAPAPQQSRRRKVAGKT